MAGRWSSSARRRRTCKAPSTCWPRREPALVGRAVAAGAGRVRAARNPAATRDRCRTHRSGQRDRRGDTGATCARRVHRGSGCCRGRTGGGRRGAGVVWVGEGGRGGPGAGEGGNDPFPPSQAAVPVTTTIGPTPGASVASYLTHAAFNLRKFGETSHDKPGYAVVDLHAYLRPDQ